MLEAVSLVLTGGLEISKKEVIAHHGESQSPVRAALHKELDRTKMGGRGSMTGNLRPNKEENAWNPASKKSLPQLINISLSCKQLSVRETQIPGLAYLCLHLSVSLLNLPTLTSWEYTFALINFIAFVTYSLCCVCPWILSPWRDWEPLVTSWE